MATIRPILQSEAAECGLACLAMVSGAHGLHIDLAELRRRFSVSLKGATITVLVRHAEALNFSARAVRLELNELPKLRLPAVLHWNLSHFVVLKAIKGNKLVIIDPAYGERILTLDEASKSFSGVALELTPTVAFQPADERRKIRFSDLTTRVVGLRRTLAQIFLVALVLVDQDGQTGDQAAPWMCACSGQAVCLRTCCACRQLFLRSVTSATSSVALARWVRCKAR